MPLDITTSSGASQVKGPEANRRVIALVAAAKSRHVGIIRARVNDRLSQPMPNTNLTFEQFNTAINNYVNELAGGQVIHPLFNNRGQQIGGVDDHGELLCIPAVTSLLSRSLETGVSLHCHSM